MKPLVMFLFLVGCTCLLYASSCSTDQSFKACALEVAKQAVAPTVESALICGDDKWCLEAEATSRAQVVADQMLSCAGKSVQTNNDGTVK